MKKKLLSLAIAAVTFSSLSAFAQATTGTDSSTTSATTCCDNTKKCCKEGKKGRGDKKGRCFNPFANLNLTAEQQTQLEALRAEQQATRDKARAEAKQKMEARKQGDKKGKNLSDAEKAARKAELDASKADRDAARQAYLDKVKAILTPEQYEQFTQNMAKMHDSKGHRDGKKGRGKDGRKGDRKGGKGHGPKGKGPRGNKQQ